MSRKAKVMNFLKESGLGHFLIIALVVTVIAIPSCSYVLRVDREPVQTAQVEVVSKRLHERINAPGISQRFMRFVTFRFSDGSEVEFNVLDFSLDEFQEGDTGIISYKQIEEETISLTTRFVSFEKDE